MAQLYSRYVSGQQFTAGAIAGSILGVSGLNPLVDRINSIASSDSVISGSGLLIYSADPTTVQQVATKNYVDTNSPVISVGSVFIHYTAVGPGEAIAGSALSFTNAGGLPARWAFITAYGTVYEQDENEEIKLSLRNIVTGDSSQEVVIRTSGHANSEIHTFPFSMSLISTAPTNWQTDFYIWWSGASCNHIISGCIEGYLMRI